MSGMTVEEMGLHSQVKVSQVCRWGAVRDQSIRIGVSQMQGQPLGHRTHLESTQLSKAEAADWEEVHRLTV
jgi:hypothetical protein